MGRCPGKRWWYPEKLFKRGASGSGDLDHVLSRGSEPAGMGRGGLGSVLCRQPQLLCSAIERGNGKTGHQGSGDAVAAVRLKDTDSGQFGDSALGDREQTRSDGGSRG